MEQYIKKLQDFMVLVRCYTFNHSVYIIDTLNGFTMQQTTFPFVVVMVDDASTDGEQEVIKNYIRDNFSTSAYEVETDYANISFAQHKTNCNCYIAAYYLKENHYLKKKNKSLYIKPWREKCKFEALCEGDDYWIDSLKIQKQVEFLEKHEDYTLYCHNSWVTNIKQNKKYKFNKYIHTQNLTIAKLIFFPWITPTASFLYRIGVNIPTNLKGINGDMKTLFTCAFHGKVYYDETIMSNYNYMTSSSMSLRSKSSELYLKKMNLLNWINVSTKYRYTFLILLKKIIVTLKYWMRLVREKYVLL